VKPALQLRIGQSLALTPQLQQAIRLLQLSSVELETELREALESNPLLEMPEVGSGQDSQDSDFSSNGAGAGNGESTPAASDNYETTANGESIDFDHTHASDDRGSDYSDSSDSRDFDSSMDFGLDRTSYGTPMSEDGDPLETQDQEQEDLRDHLLWQLNLTQLSERDRAIGAAIIEAISDEGYLTEPGEEIRDSLASIFHVTLEEVEAMRHRVQRFDPIGVGSRTLSECLRVQLDGFDVQLPGHTLARQIVCDHLETLAKNDRGKLCRMLQASAEELDAAIVLIRSLDPKPGAQVSAGTAEFVAPDAYVVKHNGRWRVSLSPHCQPKLGINQHYASLIARARRDDANYLRGQLQEARWLIKSLQTRADTMLKVATAIVRAQSAFLDFGPEAMRPLVLKEIAEEIGMHESTVSRVTTRKYLHTPRGTLEFKYFFSSGVATVDGGAASATAIQAMIKKLIGEERSVRPLSDQALTKELNKRGIEVARRTVAKYREALHIPSSNERSRLG
jgi:RNA polymerase sigma-54 factor